MQKQRELRAQELERADEDGSRMLGWALEHPKPLSRAHISVRIILTDHQVSINRLIWTVDKKCPFTGEVSIRGRILTGTVVSTKMHRTLVIRREYLHFIPKYSRYEKRHKNLAAHVSPAFRVEEGDQVTVGQCRPLSKTVCNSRLQRKGIRRLSHYDTNTSGHLGPL